MWICWTCLEKFVILAKILFCLKQFDKSLNMKGKQSPETEIMWICKNNLTEKKLWNHMKRTYFWRILETFSATVQRNGWPGRQTSFTYCAGWSANDTHNRNSSRIFVNSNELYEGTYVYAKYLSPFCYAISPRILKTVFCFEVDGNNNQSCT